MSINCEKQYPVGNNSYIIYCYMSVVRQIINDLNSINSSYRHLGCQWRRKIFCKGGLATPSPTAKTERGWNSRLGSQINHYLCGRSIALYFRNLAHH